MMDALLQTYDFSGVHAKYVDDMKDACRKFSDFKLRRDEPPVTVKGSKLYYFISPVKNGIDVQAFSSASDMEFGMLLFGVMITCDEPYVLPYMNGHRD